MDITLVICPLCGSSNECQLATACAYKGPCWCEQEEFSPALLDQVPEEARGVACVCRRCAVEARTAAARLRPPPQPADGDFYHEGRFVVFTAQYHRRRGYCCGSSCRHCPFDSLEREVARREVSRKRTGSTS